MKRALLQSVILSLVFAGCSNSGESAHGGGGRSGDSGTDSSVAGGRAGATGGAGGDRAGGTRDGSTAAGGALGDGGHASGTGGTDDGGVGAGGASTDSGRGAGGAQGGTAGAGGAGGATGGAGGVNTCGNGVCDPTDRTLSCPEDCARTLSDVGVDLQRALMWQLGTSTFLSWDAAKTYCQDLTLAGYTDFRMATMPEQEGILGNCTRDSFTGDTTCSTCAESALCTEWFSKDELSTWNSYEYGTCCGGGVDFLTGAVTEAYYKSNSIRVRCVRDVAACNPGACLGTETCVQGYCVPTDRDQ